MKLLGGDTVIKSAEGANILGPVPGACTLGRFLKYRVSKRVFPAFREKFAAIFNAEALVEALVSCILAVSVSYRDHRAFPNFIGKCRENVKL